MIDQEVEPLNLDALRNGDRKEFAKLVEMYSDSIYRVAIRMLNNPTDAEDVLQETFIKVMRSIENFEGRSNLSTWLYRIAVNESLMVLRKQKPEVAVAEDDFLDHDDGNSYPAFQILDWCCLPEKEFMTNETRKMLNQAIRNLPQSLKSVFILRDVEGLSIRETSEALDLTETNVKTRLLRARLKLREELTVYFGGRMKELRSDG
jgi:RNA polymerase sigma-70 factor (ECF subfamily)